MPDDRRQRAEYLRDLAQECSKIATDANMQFLASLFTMAAHEADERAEQLSENDETRRKGTG